MMRVALSTTPGRNDAMPCTLGAGFGMLDVGTVRT
jgi:hypothetical protein